MLSLTSASGAGGARTNAHAVRFCEQAQRGSCGFVRLRAAGHTTHTDAGALHCDSSRIQSRGDRPDLGSYFAFSGKKPHATKCDAAADCILAMDARGKWDVVPEGAAKPDVKKAK